MSLVLPSVVVKNDFCFKYMSIAPPHTNTNTNTNINDPTLNPQPPSQEDGNRKGKWLTSRITLRSGQRFGLDNMNFGAPKFLIAKLA